MTLMRPLEPEFGNGEINAKVKPTLSLLLMTDVRDKETEVATLINMAGIDTAAIVSRAAPFTSKVAALTTSILEPLLISPLHVSVQFATGPAAIRNSDLNGMSLTHNIYIDGGKPCSWQKRTPPNSSVQKT